MVLQWRAFAMCVLDMARVDSGHCPCFFSIGGTCMAYEWDPRRARRARIIRYATALAISASALTVPLAVLLAAAPI
jgi:hypothetical protein